MFERLGLAARNILASSLCCCKSRNADYPSYCGPALLGCSLSLPVNSGRSEGLGLAEFDTTEEDVEEEMIDDEGIGGRAHDARRQAWAG